MKARFKESFVGDLRSIRDKSLLGRIRAVIESIEKAESLSEVAGLKKLRGGEPYYRLRVGDNRIGLAVEEGVVVFAIALHRREVYRYFP